MVRTSNGGLIMSYKFYCYPKCSTCAKARKKLDELGLPYKEYDITTETPSAEELKGFFEMTNLGIRRFFNTSGMKYREMGLSKKLDEMSEDRCFETLASDGMLIKRPLLVGEDTVLVGYKEADYENLA